MKIKLLPFKILGVLLFVVFVLLMTDIAGLIIKFDYHKEYFHGLVPLFDLNTEKNIPTLFSVMLLLVSAALLWLISYLKRKEKKSFIYWLILGFVFLFLAIDEFTSIHERFTAPAKKFISGEGIFYWTWVVPYGMFLLLFVLFFFRFWLRLPKNTRLLFMLSGIIFVSGALILEALSGKYAEINGNTDIPYALMYTVEEVLEMTGISIFIYAQLKFIANEYGSLRINFKEKINYPVSHG